MLSIQAILIGEKKSKLSRAFTGFMPTALASGSLTKSSASAHLFDWALRSGATNLARNKVWRTTKAEFGLLVQPVQPVWSRARRSNKSNHTGCLAGIYLAFDTLQPPTEHIGGPVFTVKTAVSVTAPPSQRDNQRDAITAAASTDIERFCPYCPCDAATNLGIHI